jgi:hypothetical protein
VRGATRGGENLRDESATLREAVLEEDGEVSDIVGHLVDENSQRRRDASASFKRHPHRQAVREIVQNVGYKIKNGVRSNGPAGWTRPRLSERRHRGQSG